MNAIALYRQHTMADLVALRAKVTEKHRQSGALFLVDAAGRRKIDAIDRAITWHLADRRAAKGDPVVCDGYSGRNSNRR